MKLARPAIRFTKNRWMHERVQRAKLPRVTENDVRHALAHDASVPGQHSAPEQPYQGTIAGRSRPDELMADWIGVDDRDSLLREQIGNEVFAARYAARESNRQI